MEKVYKFFSSKNDSGGSNSKQESTSEKDATKGQGTYKNRVKKGQKFFDFPTLLSSEREKSKLHSLLNR